MGSRGKRKRKVYNQAIERNGIFYVKNLDMLYAMCISRFRWEGLPNTCDARFLEHNLHRFGIATISHPDDMPDAWQTLIANAQSPFNAYGYPVRWLSVGYNQTQYDTSEENGVLVYYSQSRANPWSAIDITALTLSYIERTKEINLSHQRTPWILASQNEKRNELENLLQQIMDGQPAVLGSSDLYHTVTECITAVNTGVELHAEEFDRTYQNVLNQFCLQMGIPHLAFEKGERMIEDEARANTAPTTLSMLNCLMARRDACDKLNSRFGLNVQVYYNDDYESLNHNYTHNLEAQAQDGKEVNGEDELEP